MTAPTLLQADVVWWSHSSIYVSCPHCERIHMHGYNNAPAQSRAPHCEGSESYMLCFPKNGEFEIDKHRILYVRAGVDPTAYFMRFDQVRKIDISDRRRWTEAVEKAELDDHHREKLSRLCHAFQVEVSEDTEAGSAIKFAVSDMILGRLEAVRHYLDTSAEKNLFLHGVEDDGIRFYNEEDSRTAEDLGPPEAGVEAKASGRTALHMAACEMYPEMVKLLLEYGADPNALMVDGRTPLMEASLWGRKENVKILLQYGANTSLESSRDGRLLRAVNLAEENYENSLERYNRAGGTSQVYREVTHERNQDRRVIVCMLNGQNERRGTNPSIKIQGLAMTAIYDGVTMTTMVAHFNVLNQYKTVGILLRGNPTRTNNFPIVAAMSGWSHPEDADMNVQIAGRRWTDEVFEICKEVQHSLPGHDYDQGKRGQYYACHAEKQLIAYFMHKHLFFASEIADDSFGVANLCLDAGPQSRLSLSDLAEIQPETRLRTATVLVSRIVCNDCYDFIQKVNSRFELRIQVQYTT